MIISLMLFSMGLGSRLSKSIGGNLLVKFIIIEFVLSFTVSFAPLSVYTMAAYSTLHEVIIYVLSILIGLMIGMEIPLVIRINEEFQELRHNISGILENDYYGSLLGGVFFAFIGLPFLGLMYTPFVLGIVNLAVAVSLLLTTRKLILKSESRILIAAATIVLGTIVLGSIYTKPIILFGEQSRYKDKVVFTEQTSYQRIVITQWKNDYWLYLNGNQQLCSRDEVMYHEPLVHPAMTLSKHPTEVLILGGGDGCAVREVLKYPSLKTAKLVDLDPKMTELARTHPILTSINQNSLSEEKVQVINDDAFQYVMNDSAYYDVIIIDLPDPRSVELGRMYSYEFYRNCYRRLRPNGVIVTQAGSPYFATKAFRCVNLTMKEAGFEVVPMHHQVITMGEWGWALGIKSKHPNLKKGLQQLQFNVPTQWVNTEAMTMMTSFGKNFYGSQVDSIRVNRIHDPVLYKYYLKGNWDLY